MSQKIYFNFQEVWKTEHKKVQVPVWKTIEVPIWREVKVPDWKIVKKPHVVSQISRKF